jgi:hypothetical protein
MEQFDFKKFLKSLDDHDFFLIIAEEFPPSQLINILLADKIQFKAIYSKVIGKNVSIGNVNLKSELNEKLTKLSLQELLELICLTVPKNSLIRELLKLDKKTQNRLMHNKIDDVINNILKKIADLAEMVFQFPNQFNEINELGELLELIDLTMESKGETDELKQSKINITEIIEKKVTNVIIEHFGDRFMISNNGIDFKSELPKIDINRVHTNTVVFDFYADAKESFVKFKGDELNEGCHFFMIWLNNVVGIPESERFIYLNKKLGEYIMDIEPFLDKVYIIEIYDMNENQLLGIINNEGDIIVEPSYSEFVILSPNYFKGYRINPNEILNELEELIEEKWVLIKENGTILEFNCKNIISVNEKNKIVTVLNHDNEGVEYSLTGNFIRIIS